MTPNTLAYLQDCFEATAARMPDAAAVDDHGETTSYRALENRANRIGHWLQARGCRPNDRVAILTGKNVHAYEAVLGILKSGACWVPMSEQFPDQRLEFVLRSIEPAAIVIEVKTRGRIEAALEGIDTVIPVLVLDEDRELETLPDTRPDRSACSPEDMAYIIFTSGSTGEPKGVIVLHRNITQFLSVSHGFFDIEEGSRFAHHSELTFDPSLFDLFFCWATGGTLVPFNRRSYRINPTKFVQETQVNVWFSVPSAITAMSRAGHIGMPELACLKHLVLTGEPLPPALVDEWKSAYPDTKIYNVYGTTETAIISHWYEVPTGINPERPVPVGTVLPGQRVTLMDGDEEVPDGEAGESVVYGSQVSPGYWRNPGENATRFVPNPLDPTLPQNVFRTGDVLRRRPDGLYEFVGRADSQVKVRGHRVELGEVEHAILPFKGVEEVAVMLDKGDKRFGEAGLVAFVAVSEPVSDSDLVAYLGEKVPGYMIPGRIVFREGELPRNANQKVDKLALEAELAQQATRS